jgi:hypothetical protein
MTTNTSCLRKFVGIVFSAFTISSCDGNEALAKDQAALAVIRLPTGIRSDSVLVLMRGHRQSFDRTIQSREGAVRMVEWDNGLQVFFLDDTLTSARIVDLTK